MKQMTLKRIAHAAAGTFGVLIDGDIPFAVTVERPWLNNEKGKSCIPDGVYNCMRVMSPKFGDTFEITNVTGRTHILFHKGNLSDDSHGCIIVGEQFEAVNGKPGILASAKGFGEFMERLKGMKQFVLTVRTIG